MSFSHGEKLLLPPSQQWQHFFNGVLTSSEVSQLYKTFLLLFVFPSKEVSITSAACRGKVGGANAKRGYVQL